MFFRNYYGFIINAQYIAFLKFKIFIFKCNYVWNMYYVKQMTSSTVFITAGGEWPVQHVQQYVLMFSHQQRGTVSARAGVTTHLVQKN